MIELTAIVFILGIFFVFTITIITIPLIKNAYDNEIIKSTCGYIFNPATTLSNYTSYKHCLEYPETYGVNK